MKMLVVREAAVRLGVSPDTVYDLCKKKKIRHERHGVRGRKILIPEDAIEEYRQSVTVGVSREAAPPPPAPRLKLKHLQL